MKTKSVTTFPIYFTLAIYFVVVLFESHAAPTSNTVELNADNMGGTIGGQNLDNLNILWGDTTNLNTGNTHISGVISSWPPMDTILRSGINVNNGAIFVSLEKKGMLNPAYMVIESLTTNLAPSRIIVARKTLIFDV